MSSVYLLVAQAGPCVPCLPHLLLWRWHMTDRHTKYPSLCLTCHLPQGQLGLELHYSSRLVGCPSSPWLGLLRCTFLQLCNVRECFYPFCSSFTPPEPGSCYLSATAGTFEVPRWRAWGGHSFVSSTMVPSYIYTHVQCSTRMAGHTVHRIIPAQTCYAVF